MFEKATEVNRASNYPNNWGVFIRDIRYLAGVSQTKLAGSLGVSQQSIARWEKGGVIPEGRKMHIASLLALSGVEVATLSDGNHMPQAEPEGEATSSLCENAKQRLLGAYVLRIERGEPSLTEIDLQLIQHLIQVES